MAAVRTGRRARRSDYLPLATATLCMLVLLAVLPSALNLPQTNPSETLEYAPVPPEDDQVDPPASGNLSSLGLGSSRSIGGQGDAAGGESSLPGLRGAGRNPSTKRCVGNPPRQTADPMAPPCVAFFRGDNGGATAAGVTRDEVVVLVYVECTELDGEDCNQYIDLAKPPPDGEEPGDWSHVWRTWQRYFNERYQTYGRFVHLWLHSGRNDTSPEARRADAAEVAGKLNPFAVIADVDINGQVYAEEWARRGRTVFLTKTTVVEEVGHDARFFQRHPGRLWSYTPSVQQLANSFGSFLCRQVVGHPVSFAGDGTNGQPRRLGLLRTADPSEQNRLDYAALVKERLERCGATIVSEQNYEGFGSPTGGDSAALNQDRVAAAMRQDGVTTIIYLTRGPSIPGFSQAVARQAPPWRPEWIVQMDNTVAIHAYEDPNVFQHARNFTVWPRVSKAAERPCEQAFLEADPQGSEVAAQWPVCYSFNDARMLFTGIQVAGPRLTWRSLDKGMHAIPAIPSGDPEVPACFYEPGDYTCVKDAQVQWWDPTSRADRANQPGCWKSIDGGRRYLPGEWPAQDVEAARRPTDGCNLQGTGHP